MLAVALVSEPSTHVKRKRKKKNHTQSIYDPSAGRQREEDSLSSGASQHSPISELYVARSSLSYKVGGEQLRKIAV